MINQRFRSAVFISFLGHMAFFSIFAFSFGQRIPRIDYAGVSFLGSILRHNDLAQAGVKITASVPARAFTFQARPDTAALDKAAGEHLVVWRYYQKPRARLALGAEKPVFSFPPGSLAAPLKRKESVITFHPQLPYHFLIYFKDRQQVHIELLFNIISDAETNSIAIKRKISSGNLEADLLSMRYIDHYLFIQQARFSPNKWQAVKIDLRPKNE